MTKEHTPEEIKNRLSNIGEAIGNIALDYIANLEKENRLLGERCTQLLKDKGDLIDQIADTKANCDLAIEGRVVKIMELAEQIERLTKEVDDLENMKATLESKIAQLEQQIEKMKCCSNCRKMKHNSIFAPICTVMNNSVIENPLGIKCDKWEIKEND